MKVFIHPSASGKVRDELEAILEEAGCEVVDGLDEIESDENDDPTDEDGVSETQTPEDEDGDSGEDAGDDGYKDRDAEPVEQPPVCIVVLDDDLTQAELEPVLTQAVGRRCKVIGVWAPGAGGNVSALEDYGADTVSWDSGKIRSAIWGVPQHLGPSGEVAKGPKSTHGGCAK